MFFKGGNSLLRGCTKFFKKMASDLKYLKVKKLLTPEAVATAPVFPAGPSLMMSHPLPYMQT